eukprot:352749-Chlamydomonas_euryale.AAC.3
MCGDVGGGHPEDGGPFEGHQCHAGHKSYISMSLKLVHGCRRRSCRIHSPSNDSLGFGTGSITA